MRRTGVQAAYAYHIIMGEAENYPNHLSFGLSMTAYQYFINTEGLIYDHNDQFLNTYDRSVFIPDFNFGTSFTTAKYYVGFSMSNLLRGRLLFGNSSDTKRNELGHYFLTGGIKLPLSINWLIEPSVLMKSSDMVFKSMQTDMTARIYYKNDYWAGLSYRTNDAIIAMFGIKLSRFYFAYSVDFTLTDIRRQSNGTHELTLAVKLGANARRYRWINEY